MAQLLRLFFWLLLVLPGLQPAAAQEAVPSTLPLASIAEALRGGGYVVYFRHADTGAPTAEPPGVDINRCETQRNLIDRGREQARGIGEQFRRLRIPVGKVLSSEFCRCRDTAQLAFGRFELTRTLTVVRREPEFEPARRAAAHGLRKLLATAPAPGENTVLVSHGFNLIDLEGIYLSEQGEAAIYLPDGVGGYTLVARVKPDAWAGFLASARTRARHTS